MGLQPHLFKLTETTSNRNTNYTNRNTLFGATLKKNIQAFSITRGNKTAPKTQSSPAHMFPNWELNGSGNGQKKL